MKSNFCFLFFAIWSDSRKSGLQGHRDSNLTQGDFQQLWSHTPVRAHTCTLTVLITVMLRFFGALSARWQHLTGMWQWQLVTLPLKSGRQAGAGRGWRVDLFDTSPAGYLTGAVSEARRGWYLSIKHPLYLPLWPSCPEELCLCGETVMRDKRVRGGWLTVWLWMLPFLNLNGIITRRSIVKVFLT